MTSVSKSEVNCQQILEKELERLKRILNAGYELKVKWIPRNNGNLCGEVKGNYIFIYDENIEDALMTLKHEVVDYAISKVIEPYMQVTNKLIALLNERAYQQKERLIENLIKLV